MVSGQGPPRRTLRRGEVADVLSLGPAVRRTGRADPAPLTCLTILRQPATHHSQLLLLDGTDLRPARAGDGAVTALVERWRTGRFAGRFHLDWQVDAEPGRERQVSTDQVNLSVASGEVLVKLLETVTGEVDTALRLTRHLAAVGFTAMPQHLGVLSWEHAGRRAPVAIASRFLPDAEEGWIRYRDLASASLREGAPPRFDAAAALGHLVATFHLAVATPSAELPEPETASRGVDHLRWFGEADATLSEALAEVTGEPAVALAANAGVLRARIARLTEVGLGSPVVPLHGDLHVGQVLTAGDRLYLTDLDGDPGVTAAARSAPGPPARDVAAMLRSLDHVGRLAALRGDPVDAGAVTAWITGARAACLDAYTATLAEHGREGLLVPELIPPFEAAQVSHELLYGTRHLPSWLAVAHAALRALVTGADDGS